MILPLLLTTLFGLLGLLHFYWLFGGVRGFEAALPTREDGQRVLNPKRIDTAVVAIALTAFAAFYLLRSGVVEYRLPQGIVTYAGWIIPSLFVLRAIGEFRYVGFFKKVKSTPFGKLDSKYYSPLCLLLGVMGIFVQLVY